MPGYVIDAFYPRAFKQMAGNGIMYVLQSNVGRDKDAVLSSCLIFYPVFENLEPRHREREGSNGQAGTRGRISVFKQDTNQEAIKILGWTELPDGLFQEPVDGVGMLIFTVILAVEQCGTFLGTDVHTGACQMDSQFECHSAVY